jgi:hypothetical protein
VQEQVEDKEIAKGFTADPRWQQTFYLDRLYAICRVAPFGSPLLRAVKKVRKRDNCAAGGVSARRPHS